MPKEIFVDTGAFVALEDESDQYHDEAIQFREHVLRQENYNIISSSYVLDETLTLIRARLGVKTSIGFSRQIRKSKIIKFIRVSEEIEKNAIKIFESYEDKTFSFTDCVSFAIMKQREMREAFTFDLHFDQMGFIRRP